MSAPKLSRLISVVGPTASGKTAQAAKLAHQELAQGKRVSVISLDARQIYRELPILTGADVEVWQQLQANHQRLRVLYLACFDLPTEWSLGKLLADLSKQHWHQDEVVILLGGTLLYHERFLSGNNLTTIPPNDNIRYASENMSVDELGAWLKKINVEKWTSLNDSDRHNPRRLVRHLEISLHQQLYPPTTAEAINPIFSTATQEFLIPDFNRNQLEEKIRRRVEERFEGGAIAEVQQVEKKYASQLTDKNFTQHLPLGFSEIQAYLRSELDEQAYQQLWALKEWQYAKRQLTYLKKLSLSHDLVITPT